jgi:precorrin-2 dehydrogenase/sirohydrochlorin ferrochelatase
MPVDEPLFPINVRLSGYRCLVVGGGHVAEAKARKLLAAGAIVDVVAPQILDSLAVLQGVTAHRRPYRNGEVEGYRLVITATDDPRVNAAVFADGEQAAVLVNSADDPANCGFTLPAVVRRGQIMFTVSTGGHSPALASWFRRGLEADIGPEYETLLEILADERRRLRSDGKSTALPGWQKALNSGMLEAIRAGRIDEAKEILRLCLS